MKLYDYPRSTACYRVRLALEIKQIAYERIEINLIHNGGEQKSEPYLKINPQGLVPSLTTKGKVLHQSLAIIDYLDETYPEVPLLPKDPFTKALLRSLALLVACDIHPLNNLRVLNQLKQQFNAQEEEVMHWYHHWLKAGFDAFEQQLTTLKRSKPLCFGSELSLADVCLIPQVYNANRFNFPMKAYPLISEINDYCLSLPAFQKAAP